MPSSSRPILGTPSRIAIVAGTTPLDRSICSNSLAASRFLGLGKPCEIIVLSRATTGLPVARASATSGEAIKEVIR